MCSELATDADAEALRSVGSGVLLHHGYSDISLQSRLGVSVRKSLPHSIRFGHKFGASTGVGAVGPEAVVFDP